MRIQAGTTLQHQRSNSSKRFEEVQALEDAVQAGIKPTDDEGDVQAEGFKRSGGHTLLRGVLP